MLSRIAYLSKYTSGGDDSKERKKKGKKDKHKKKKKNDDDDTIITRYSKNSKSIAHDDEEAIEESLLLEEGEGAPVQIEVTREFKGFKRIDNQEAVQPSLDVHETNDSNEVTKSDHKQPETIYRDISGRKINIDEKREEVRLKKEREAKEEAKYSEYIKNDEAEVSYKVEKKKLNEFFDDPFKQPSYQNLNDGLHYQGVNVPNRFGIVAGILWDGIDRSNGFEQLLMKKRQETKVGKLDLQNDEEYDFE